jgi:hypothetical protein
VLQRSPRVTNPLAGSGVVDSPGAQGGLWFISWEAVQGLGRTTGAAAYFDQSGSCMQCMSLGARTSGSQACGWGRLGFMHTKIHPKAGGSSSCGLKIKKTCSIPEVVFESGPEGPIAKMGPTRHSTNANACRTRRIQCMSCRNWSNALIGWVGSPRTPGAPSMSGMSGALCAPPPPPAALGHTQEMPTGCGRQPLSKSKEGRRLHFFDIRVSSPTWGSRPIRPPGDGIHFTEL